MEPDFLFLVSIVLLVTVVVYTKIIAARPDVDEYFLYHQSSVDTIRRPGETAIYRSLVAGHGRSLMTGLSIAKQYGTRDGNMLDLWTLSQKSEIAVAVVDKHESYKLDKLKRHEFSRLVYGFGHHLSQWAGISLPITAFSNTPVAILLPPGLEALICLFACNLFGLTAAFLPIGDLDEEKLQTFVATVDPVIIIGQGNILNKLDYSRLKSVKALLSVQIPLDSKSTDTGGLIVKTWSEVANACNDDDTATSYANDALKAGHDDPNYIPVKFAYEEVADNAISGKGGVRVASFSTQSLVASIAAQIKVLPVHKSLSSSDKVIVFTTQITPTVLVRQLSAFVVGASLIFPESIYAVESPTSLMKAVEPTILIMDDRTSYSLYHSAENLNVVGWIKLRVGLSHLSHGNVPTSAVDAAFNSLRLIYTDYSTYGEHDYITTAQANTIRALTAARVIHSLSTPLECGPVAQTSFYDYRNEDDSKYENFGPVLPCFEAILRDNGNHKSEARQGQLWVRGPATSNGLEWANTNVVGKFAHDGCFKILNQSIAEAY